MSLRAYRHRIRICVLIFITSFVFLPGSLAIANDLAPKVKLLKSDKNYSTPIELSVRGASAGITADYYEQAVVDAINSSDIFPNSDNKYYSLDIRIVKIDTPSFSKNMTVSMKAVWKFYRTAEKTPLFEKNILSTYTGKAFEGGLIGANRVRVAMEGAARESVRTGMGLLATLNLNK